MWAFAALSAGLLTLFAFGFMRPSTPRDWRSLGAFSAFVVALFTEMYGLPLTIYLLSGWLRARYPEVDMMSHDAGHLRWSLLGLGGDSHGNVIHLLSVVVIILGFVLLAASWRVLHAARRDGELARSGPYRHVRHPQYVGLIAILAGFLLQCPTLLMAVMFPVLVAMYVRLARVEEADTRRAFGAAHDRYAAVTPGLIPRLRAPAPDGPRADGTP